jgi:DNA polymerase III sliding clamp (beta) subunit (PCNA family)
MSVTVKAADLRQALGKVKHAVAKDEGRPILTCVHIHGHEGKLRLAAADNYRIAIADVEIVEGDATELKANLPRWAMSIVDNLLRGYGTKTYLASRQVTLEIVEGGHGGSRLMVAEPGGDAITVRLMEGMFPNYLSVTEIEGREFRATVHAEYLEQMAAAAKSYGIGNLDILMADGMTSIDFVLSVDQKEHGAYREIIMPVRTTRSPQVSLRDPIAEPVTHGWTFVEDDRVAAALS